MSEPTLSERFIAWAQRERAIEALTLIGSRTRDQAAADAADEYSDWDFQVVTTRPEIFAGRNWVRQAGLGEPNAYVVRDGRLGTALKVTAVFPSMELDLVIIPAARLRILKWLHRLRLAGRIDAAKRARTDLATVLRGGFRIVKGERAWGGLFTELAADIAPRRLSDEQVRNLADGFVCDYVSTLRKTDRGEFLAAQRWLHHHLAETNFVLHHELQQRRGQLSYPDARRLETTFSEEDLARLRVAASPTQSALRQSARNAANTCRRLTHDLVGDTWQWPAAID